ncbi:MAG TPA: hypothetical protein GX731_09595 [Clostridiales bacterium]|nr:hypothetical protein [Clostridiales bacterium]
MSEYTSLIIDIKKSRTYDLQDRNDLQVYLSKCVKQLNMMFKESIRFDVTFSAGDELQGMFYDTVSAVMYLRLLSILINPVEVRAGIGVGEWNVRIEDGLSTEQDGPAYHQAREAIEEVYKMQTQRFRISSTNNDDVLANYMLNASMNYIQNQNYIQSRILLLLELMYPFVNKTVNPIKVTEVKNLLELKAVSIISKNDKKTGDITLDFNNVQVIEMISITEEAIDAEDIIIKKNMSSMIAEVEGSTRQNIDKLIKRGNSIIIRIMDYMALKYIKKAYGGNYDL